MQRPVTPLLSDRYRSLAEECREKARSLRDELPRAQLLQQAADYERSAIRAQKAEEWLQKFSIDSASVVPK